MAQHANIAQNLTTLQAWKLFIGKRSGSRSGDLQSQESTISRCDKIRLNAKIGDLVCSVPPWVLLSKIVLLTRQQTHHIRHLNF